MYKNLFDKDIDEEVDAFFLENLAELGRVKSFKKGQVIEEEGFNNVYVVLEGQVDRVMYSKQGDQAAFYRLTRGSLFGLVEFFDKRSARDINRAVTDCLVSVIKRKVLEAKLLENPEIYRYFMLDVIRKKRIVMIKFANVSFNDSIGRMADFLIGVYYIHSTEKRDPEKPLSIAYTHEDMANRLVLNRRTITRIMKFFKEEGLIEVQKRRIIIKDIDRLKEYTNIPLDEE